MIESAPGTWQDLQDRVAAILGECSMTVEVEKDVRNVRDTVNIDVFAEDTEQRPPAKLLCECKHWRKAVPKTVVHSLRTVVSDTGANWGLIISSSGFQSGAREAAANSNIRLLHWHEFEEMFAERWWKKWAMPRLKTVADPMVEFTEPFFSQRMLERLQGISEAEYHRYSALLFRYQDVSAYAMCFYVDNAELALPMPTLPITVRKMEKGGIPQEIQQQTTLRGFVGAMCKVLREGDDEFRELFKLKKTPA